MRGLSGPQPLQLLEDLAAELVWQKRLRPYPEWAGGEVMAAVQSAASVAAAEAMF